MSKQRPSYTGWYLGAEQLPVNYYKFQINSRCCCFSCCTGSHQPAPLRSRHADASDGLSSYLGELLIKI